MANEPRSQTRGEGGTRIWDRARRFVVLRDSLPENVSSPRVLIESIFDGIWWGSYQHLTEIDLLDLESLKNAALGLLADVEQSEPSSQDPGTLLRQTARSFRQQIAAREPFVTADRVDVPIHTLWGGKGLTADHVYMIGVCDEAIPGMYDESYPGTENEFIQEQQRLMYVSITRPRKSLVISRPMKVRRGDAKRLGLKARRGDQQWLTLQMSSFMRSILRWLPDAVAGDSWGGID